MYVSGCSFQNWAAHCITLPTSSSLGKLLLSRPTWHVGRSEGTSPAYRPSCAERLMMSPTGQPLARQWISSLGTVWGCSQTAGTGKRSRSSSSVSGVLEGMNLVGHTGLPQLGLDAHFAICTETWYMGLVPSAWPPCAR